MGIPLGQPNSGSYPITPYLITPPETSTVPGDRSIRAPVPGSVIFPAPTVIGQSGLPSAPANRPIGRTQADRVATVTVGDIGAAAQTAQPFPRFEMAQRILELSDEIRRLRQRSTALSSQPAENLPTLKASQANERLARAKLALAESEWQNMGSQLRAQADEADQRLESAQQRSPETLQAGFAPWEDVLQWLRSEAQTLRQNYEAWSRTDQVLRSAIDDLNEPEPTNASQRPEASSGADNVSTPAENSSPEETVPAKETALPEPVTPDTAVPRSPEPNLLPAETPEPSTTPSD